METKVSFAVVGAFVLLLSAAAIGVLLWLGSGRISQRSYDTYLAFFGESVSGLNVHAPVKYRGVDVGSVREIGLDPSDPERVRLVLDIQRGAPVKEDTVAVLSMQGLTGIAFVDLGGGSRESPTLRPDPKLGIPVIRTAPSLMRRLDTAATTLLGDLDQTSQRVSSLLDEQTRRSLQQTLRELGVVVHTLAARSQVIDAGLVGAGRTFENTARASAELSRLIERIGRSADAVERMAGEVSQAGAAARAALDGVRGAVERARGGVEHVSGEALPELGRLVADMRETTVSLGRVARELERNPSALVLGRPPAPPGPGE